jgi:hypothetical protein
MPSSILEDSRITFGYCEHFYCHVFTLHFNLKTRAYGLDITNGKVTVGGDGSPPMPFTSRPDIARYLSYVLTHLPADQLKNRSFTIAGDTKVRTLPLGHCGISMLNDRECVKSVV